MVYIKAIFVCVLLFAAAMCVLVGSLLPTFTWDGGSARPSIPSEVNGGGASVANAEQIDIYLFQRVVSSTGGKTTKTYAKPGDIDWACGSVRDRFATAMAFTALGWVLGFTAVIATIFGPYLVALDFSPDVLFCGYGRFWEFVGVSFTVAVNIVLVIVWNLALDLRSNVQCDDGDDFAADGNFYSGNTFRSEGYTVSGGLQLIIAAWALSLVAVFLHVLTFTESMAEQSGDSHRRSRRFR
jgi:hypothetical protein